MMATYYNTMKRILLFIAIICLPLMASAQIVEAVKWSGEEIPATAAGAVDSVRLTATIQEGWHMTLISVGDEEIGEEIYDSPFTLTFAANEVLPIRYNSCNDQMCTAPDIYSYEVESRKSKDKSSLSGEAGLSSVSDSGLSAEGGLISSLREVYEFALNVPLQEIAFLLEGAKMNMAAAEKSFMGSYGHGLGRLLHTVSNQHLTNSPHTQMSNIFGDTLFTKILCYTCGACDARMSGAMVPVMSNSGSGNQGISCSIPVYLYALEHNMNEEQTLRALTLSNLTVVYIKQSLGRLSALCGCVVAATGSAAGLTYLMGGQYDEVTFAIKNMIANISGMICDGAKPACALKVTSGVATAVLSASMAMHHSFAEATEGIVEDDIDRTIHNLTRIGHDGMCQTDDLIIDIMTHKN